jgi:branched-chain amino acid transport system substrate-binding protein
MMNRLFFNATMLVSFFSTMNLEASHSGVGVQLGFSGSLSGHFGTYGTMITRGMQAAFKAHPYTLGGEKKHVYLLCMDDHGDAATTKKNIQTMQENGITIFAGVMGTRGALAILPDLKAQKIALLFPWGTHKSLQDPGLTSIVNSSGLMAPQITQLAKTIVQDKQLSRIAIFHADDDFSTQAAEHCTQTLTEMGKKPLVVADYNRYTFDLETATENLFQHNPRVIICISASMPAVKLINNLFVKGRYGTQFYGIDSTFLVPDILASKGVPFAFTSAVPNPLNNSLPLAEEYMQDLKTYFPTEQPSVLSFSYYICGRLIVEAIQQSKTTDKDSIISALSNMHQYNLGGFIVDFNPQNRYLFGSKTWLIGR